MMDKNEVFLQELARLKEVRLDELHETTSLQDCGVWDSMVVVSVMAMADEKFGVALNPRHLMECKTVGDLAKLFGL